jgi:two-component system, OmpR family, sensor histidine kinase TctE
MKVETPSLRARLQRNVLIPLFFTWALGTATIVSIAYYFAGRAFDRAILDDAYAIASHVDIENGVPRLRISQAEITSLLFDQTEQVYFAVFDAQGFLRAGHGGLRGAGQVSDASTKFSDIFFQGRALRTATIRNIEPVEFTVVVGLTTISREQLLRRLALYSLLPQAFLLLLLAWWLRRVISREVAPLNELQTRLQLRDLADLSPIQSAARISDIRELTDAINDLLARIDNGITSQKEFIGNVAHELRTPLAGIRALANYALSHHDPHIWQQQLQSIVQSEHRASHMVDQLLALALAAEANATMQLEPVALDKLVSDAILRFLPRADALGADLGAHGLISPCIVLGHTALLEGILNNLIDNALRYGRHDAATQPLRITVEMRAEGSDMLALEVSDNGPGLSDEKSAQLQARWARGDSQHNLTQGAGLGLAIVGKYADLMQSQFSLQSGKSSAGLTARLVLRRVFLDKSPS